MKWQQFVMDEFLRIEDELGQVLKGLTVEDLNTQPAPDCNSIGWLAWHLTRSHDRNMSEVMGEEQLWIAEKWHVKFNRAPDPGETGVGHTTEQAKAFQSPEAAVILAYHHAILHKNRKIHQYQADGRGTGPGKLQSDIQIYETGFETDYRSDSAGIFTRRAGRLRARLD